MNSDRSLLDRVMDLTGLSLAEIAEKVAISEKTLENARSSNRLGEKRRQLIEQLVPRYRHGIPLLGEYREAAPRKRRVGLNVDPVSARVEATAATGGLVAVRIPVVSFAQAGAALSMNWEDIEDYEGMETFAVRDRRSIAVRIRGDSMAPDFREGTVAVLYTSFEPRSENLVIAKLKDGSVIFKRLHIVGDKYHFLSINPAYAPIVVTADQIERMHPVGQTITQQL